MSTEQAAAVALAVAAAGAAAASRQESKKARTEKVGTSGNPRKKMSSSIKKAAKDAFDIHPILDAVGFVPVLGEPADFVNGLIYAAEKDYINAGISMAAVIPVVGDAGKAVKYGAKAIEKSKGLKKIGKTVTKPLSKKSSKTYQAGRKSLKKTAADISYAAEKEKKTLLSNVEARKWYLARERRIPELIDKSLTLEEQARQAFALRNKFRTEARELMADREIAEELYRTDPNRTWDEIFQRQIDRGIIGDDIYKEM